jgi:hypothetical protein
MNCKSHSHLDKKCFEQKAPDLLTEEKRITLMWGACWAPIRMALACH